MAAAATPSSTDQNPTKIIQNEGGEVIAFLDLVDNTLIIPDLKRSGAESASDQYGAKRFVFADDTADGAASKVQKFDRDVLLDITALPVLTTSSEVCVGQESLKQKFPDQYQFYTETLPVLFSGAEFTPTKMAEYEKGAADKWCRFSGECITPIALLAKEGGHLQGVIRVALVEGCAYLSDEMVDPRIDKASDAYCETLAVLFHNACHYAKDQGARHVLIRMASEREEIYKTAIRLATSKDAESVAKGSVGVIHGKPTLDFEKLKGKALETAAANLAKLKPSVASVFGSSSALGVQPSARDAEASP